VEQVSRKVAGDITISPISIADVGDDRLAIEIGASAHSAELSQAFDSVAQFVAIRRGRLIGVLIVRATGSPHPLEEVEDLARALDERMKDALEQAPAP
jgi:hypothetical protein